MLRALIVLTGSNVWTMKNRDVLTLPGSGPGSSSRCTTFHRWGSGGQHSHASGHQAHRRRAELVPPYNNDDEGFIAEQKKAIEALAPELSAPS